MILNKQYRKLYRRYMRKKWAHKRNISLWLDRKSERHIQIMAVLFFLGFILTIAYGYKTLLSWSQISQLFFGFAVIFSFIPVKWLPLIYRIRKELKVLLGICALAPFFTGLFLVLNYYIIVDTHKETVAVTKFIYDYNDQALRIQLENKELNQHIEIRKFPLKENKIEPDSAVFVICKGILGISTVHESWLIPKQ